MKAEDLLNAIGEIDDSYLDVAIEKPKPRKMIWFGSLAACFLLVLVLPYGFLHGMYFRNSAEVDYAAKDYTRFSVYYPENNKLSSMTYEIQGGYEEMFFAWKKQNGIGEEVFLKEIVLNPSSQENFDTAVNFQSEKILRISISSTFSAYLDENTKDLLLESLKKTVASYTGFRIVSIELIFVE